MIKTSRSLLVDPTNVEYNERLCYLTAHFNSMVDPIVKDPITGAVTISYAFIVKFLDYLTYENSNIFGTREILTLSGVIAYENDTDGVSPTSAIELVDTILVRLAEGLDISRYVHDAPITSGEVATDSCATYVAKPLIETEHLFKSNYCGEHNA